MTCKLVVIILVSLKLCSYVHSQRDEVPDEAFTTTQPTTRARPSKPGACPGPLVTGVQCPLRTPLCGADADCPRRAKCCSDGCTNTCRAPLASKTGLCPRVRMPPCSTKLCAADSDCVGQLRCCAGGCACALFTPLLSSPVLG